VEGYHVEGYYDIGWLKGLWSTQAKVEGILVQLASTFPVTGLEWPRGFQEVKVLRFHDNGAGWW